MRKVKKLGKRCTRIIGKPGTGKTTTLAKTVLPILERDIDYYSHRIIGANFSRSSARALIGKLREKGISMKELPYFRTIHSLCARTLKLKDENYVQSKDYEWFCKEYNLPFKPFSVQTLDDIELYGVVGVEHWEVKGNIMLRWFQSLKKGYIYPEAIEENIRRRTGLNKKEISILGTSTEDLFNIFYHWEEWKRNNGKFEFDDMLQEIVLGNYPFKEDIEYAIVDEFQDLSPLQIKVLDQFLCNAERVWIAGDPMQCIYFFNQADPELFMDLEVDDENILPRSYRVPSVPWEYVRTFAHLAGDKTIDRVSPADREGDFRIISKDAVYDLLREEERSIFVLLRTNREVRNLVHKLFRAQIPVKGLGRKMTAFNDQSFVSRYNLIVKLYQGDPLKYDEVRFLLLYIPTEYLVRGVKTNFRKGKAKDWWDDEREDTHTIFYNLFRIDIGDVESIKDILREPKVRMKREKKDFLLSITPETERIEYKKLKKYIGTMHSSKGLEADSVIVFDYLPNRYAKLREEHRLNAVALSRTRDVNYMCLLNKSPGIIERNL